MNIQIDPNVAQLKPSATLAMHQRANAMRSDGELITHFGFGQSPFTVPASIAIAATAVANDFNNFILGLQLIIEFGV